jgi:hypothetical protein
LLAALYTAVALAATYPRGLRARSELPSLVDPIQHLTVMRWYKSCLLEGRAPWVMTGIQYPVGAPLGNFSPLALQGALYVPLSFIEDDICCYNILWFLGLVGTGLGAAALAGVVVEDRACAAYAGAAAMASGPVLLHALEHLELIYAGAIGLFLAAWVRFVDRPGPRRLAPAAGAYLLTVMAAAYFALLAAVPAAWFVGYKFLRRDDGASRGRRAAWVAAFGLAVAPGLALLFAGPIWSASHGQGLHRPLAEFRKYSAPAWSYVVPTGLHPLQRLLRRDAYDAAGYPTIECASYLGLVPLLLIARAAIGRARLKDAGYWWSAFALLVVLSFGPALRLRGFEVPMPAGWLRAHVAPFRLIRAPSRFNLPAAVVAAVLAAAGLRDVLGGARRRNLVVGVAVVLTVAELAIVPFRSRPVPPLPACYRLLTARGGAPAIVEAPMFGSGFAEELSALGGYWQSFHGARTTAGYCGVPNAAFDDLMVHESPFNVLALREPDFLRDPKAARFGVVAGVDPLDFLWLYMTAHRLDSVVRHRRPGAIDIPLPGLDRLDRVLARAKFFEDEATIVADRSLIPTPTRPVAMPLDGWSDGWTAGKVLTMRREARLILFVPDAARACRLRLTLRAEREPRSVSLRADGRPLARFEIATGPTRPFTTPPLRLDAGLHTLTLAVDRGPEGLTLAGLAVDVAAGR